MIPAVEHLYEEYTKTRERGMRESKLKMMVGRKEEDRGQILNPSIRGRLAKP